MNYRNLTDKIYSAKIRRFKPFSDIHLCGENRLDVNIRPNKGN